MDYLHGKSEKIMSIAIYYFLGWFALWFFKAVVGEATFAWYDFWVGWYYDRKVHRLYICPFPCFVIWWNL